MKGRQLWRSFAVAEADRGGPRNFRLTRLMSGPQLPQLRLFKRDEPVGIFIFAGRECSLGSLKIYSSKLRKISDDIVTSYKMLNRAKLICIRDRQAKGVGFQFLTLAKTIVLVSAQDNKSFSMHSQYPTHFCDGQPHLIPSTVVEHSKAKGQVKTVIRKG